MNKRKSKGNLMLALLGLVFVAAGLYLAIFNTDAQGVMLTLPFAFIGIGMGALGAAAGVRIIKNDSAQAKQAAIEARDERNIAISQKANSKTFALMFLVHSALLIFLAVVQVELFITMVFLAAYILMIVVRIYLGIKYGKEM